MSRFAGTVTFTEVSALNLAQTDRRSDSDPYVRWENADTGDVLAETHFLRNVLGRRGGRTAGSARTPRWDSEYSADLPLGVGPSFSVRVSVWDSDRGADDLLGDALLEVSRSTTTNQCASPWLRALPAPRDRLPRSALVRAHR